jgi:hypothetical protein
MFKRLLASTLVLVMVLSALPQVSASWVEPVPGSKTDDAFWHVTYKFEAWWANNWPNYTAESSNREPDIAVFHGKLWTIWEGLLVPNSKDQPVSYKGKLYMRSYTDLDGNLTWGDYIDVTPNAYYADHDNQKARLISYKDRLYIFWMSYDRNQKPKGTPENRFDVLMRTYDGNEMLQLTPPEIIGRDGVFGDWGIDQNPQPIIFNDKLYVVWYREDISRSTRDILYRVFDGNTWSDIKALSNWPNNNTSNVYPTVAVYNNKTLYVMWQQSVNGTPTEETVYSYTTDGHSWSTVATLSRRCDATSGIWEMMPAMATYHNPKTGKDELHAFWRTYGCENTQNGIRDYSIVGRVFDGSTWAPTQEISRTDSWYDNIQPYAIEYGGNLQIFWTSKDPATADGNDYDIVRVIHDGETYSKPETVSRVGDVDETFVDDNEFWNKGTDLNPKAVVFPDKWGDPRLFLTFWTFDYITGCCYDHPEDVHPTIVLRLLEDADHDRDGVPDHTDLCAGPFDPPNWTDPDGDGLCENIGGNNTHGNPGPGPKGDPMPLYLVLLVLFIAAVALLAYRGDKKRPRPKKEEVTGRSEGYKAVDGHDEAKAGGEEE